MAADEHDATTRTTTETTNAKAAVKDQNETRVTNVTAAEEQDEETTTNAATNADALGTTKTQTAAIDLLSFGTDDAATATEKKMNMGTVEVTIGPESSQRRMVVETRRVREINREWEERTRGSFEERGMNRFWSTLPQGLKRGASRDVTEEPNTLKEDMCETTDGDRTDGNAERERR